MTIKLDKWVWTELDFEEMGWHDCYIHAFAFQPKEFELVLDIDYIFQWVQPEPDEAYFKFWVSPATLVFENVYNIVFDLSTDGSLQIESLSREEPKPPRNKDFIHRDLEWRWTIDCFNGSVSFYSAGYKQYVRAAPQLGNEQQLGIQTRGGLSFLRGTLG